jgi:hypothetical protein
VLGEVEGELLEVEPDCAHALIVGNGHDYEKRCFSIEAIDLADVPR